MVLTFENAAKPIKLARAPSSSLHERDNAV